MLRSWRRWRHFGTLVWTLVAVWTASGDALADDSFHPPSTLAAEVAPQDLGLDAVIASMVKRGLLADVEQPPAVKPATPPKAAPTARPGAHPAPPPQGSGWRAAGSGAGARPAPPQRPAAQPPVGRHPQWQSSAAARGGANRRPPAMAQPQTIAPEPEHVEPRTAVAPPSGGAPLLRAPALNDGPVIAAPIVASEPIPAPRTASKPTPLESTTDHAPQPDAATPVESDAAAAPTNDADEPAPAAEEQLAPIDDLPETPAPAHDAPGDPREPEVGDENYSGDADSAAKPLPGAPAAGSLTKQQMTPAGEPDRIEQPDRTAPPPTDPRNFQDDDEPVAAPPARVPPMSRNQRLLRDKVRSVLKYYYDHPLNTGDRSPWEVMHQMLAYEVHSRIRQEGPQGDPITAVGWLCFNQPCKGRTLMYLNEGGDLRVKVGPALQGHNGQLLALLAQARVRADYPLRVEGKSFTVADLIEMEKATSYPRTELTFKLLGLQRYLDIDARWMNDQGMQWDFPTMLREEMRQPIRTAACGGTHRLSGLILTVKKRQRSGQPVNGAYAEAAKLVASYQNYALRLQNPDGSFSTEWFKGPGTEEDIDRRLKTTGHQLEFMIYAANEQQLAHFRTVRAVNYLANIMWANRGRDWEAGPLGHAIHALVLYDRLVFAKYDQPAGAAPTPVAKKAGRNKR